MDMIILILRYDILLVDVMFIISENEIKISDQIVKKWKIP